MITIQSSSNSTVPLIQAAHGCHTTAYRIARKCGAGAARCWVLELLLAGGCWRLAAGCGAAGGWLRAAARREFL
eukprot:COSAG01_NODE_47980_length_385_cov_0.814685_1_plen_74_part_00